ncbi:MAG: Nif3-like dinuclear metal center hexameric protein [Clostridia bacterium]|nr:Nif3-like dinuclear metal center hexameric protein [Clostridia bacterium]
MISQRDLIDYIESFAPAALAAEFDNVGLLLGHTDKEINRALLCLDADLNVVKEAVRIGADIVISHHPVIFDSLKRLCDDTPQGEALLLAAKNGISLYAAHTNFDEAKGGMNDSLSSMLGMEVVSPLCEAGGRLCAVKPAVTLGELCQRVSHVLGVRSVYTTHDLHKSIHTAALCTGGGASLSQAAIDSGADVYISGDLKHAQILGMSLSNTAYIEIRHYDSEIIFTKLFSQRLAARFGGGLDIRISQCGENPLREVRE